MNDAANMPEVFGLADEDRLAVETLYRALSEGDPEWNAAHHAQARRTQAPGTAAEGTSCAA